MEIFNLPEDILYDRKTADSDIILYHYSSHKESIKERAVLNRNALSLVLRGQKTMHFAESVIDTNETEIHLLSAGNCIASVHFAKQKIFESILIFFTDKVLDDFYTANASFIESVKKKYPPDRNAYLSFPKDDFIDTYIRSLLLSLKKKGPLSESMKHLKLQEILLYLLENHSNLFLRFHPAGELSGTGLSIRKVVEANKFSNLSLEEMAFLCNVSVSTFKRQFRKIYKTAPHTWITEQRMKIAGQLLRQGKEKPGEIWLKLGFETHTGFTKAFKKHFGSLPSTYASGMNSGE